MELFDCYGPSPRLCTKTVKKTGSIEQDLNMIPVKLMSDGTPAIINALWPDRIKDVDEEQLSGFQQYFYVKPFQPMR